MTNHDEIWMKKCLELAKRAADLGEVPVGALIVRGDEVLAEAFNLKESKNSPLAHAELLAIEEASKKIGAWRLQDCTMFVNLEPCPMCAGALVHARIQRLVYASRDLKTGAVDSIYQITNDSRLNHQIEVSSGILAQESSELISGFFRDLRAKKSDSEKK